MGMGFWTPWDFGLTQSSSLGYEIASWGLFTQKDNEYNGVEASKLGSDGIPNTWDDEKADFGNFTGPVEIFLRDLYHELLDSTTDTVEPATTDTIYQMRLDNIIWNNIRWE